MDMNGFMPIFFMQAAALKGDTPPGLSPKRTGQDLTDVQQKVSFSMSKLSLA